MDGGLPSLATATNRLRGPSGPRTSRSGSSPLGPHVLHYSALSDKSPFLFAEAFSPAFSPAFWLALSSELSGFHSKFYRLPPSRFEVQELESWETGKISVKGDKAAAAGDREGC